MANALKSRRVRRIHTRPCKCGGSFCVTQKRWRKRTDTWRRRLQCSNCAARKTITSAT